MHSGSGSVAFPLFHRLKTALWATALIAVVGLLPASAKQLAATAAASAPPVPLLWKVSDADNAVYLLGSFHLLKPGDYPLSSDVDAAFASADRLVFEIAPEEMGSPALAMQMGQAALRTDGTQLNSELPAETVAALEAWVLDNAAQLGAMQMNGQVLQMFEPWFVGLMITIVELTVDDPSRLLVAGERLRRGNSFGEGVELDWVQLGDRPLAGRPPNSL
jgi:uncharacterized protein